MFELLIIYGLFLICYVLYKLIDPEDHEHIKINELKVSTKIIFFIVGIIFLFLLFGKNIYGEAIPGSWREKDTYETKISVNLFKDQDYSKNYRVIGDLRVFRECEDAGDGSECYSVANIDKVTFPNGGWIEFDECRVQLNKKIRCININNSNENWYVELTNIPVK